MKLVWKEPTRRAHGAKVITAEVHAALRKRPGTWARIHGPGKYHTMATNRQNWKRHFPDLELVVRTEAGGSFVYARYIRNGKRAK